MSLRPIPAAVQLSMTAVLTYALYDAAGWVAVGYLCVYWTASTIVMRANNSLQEGEPK